MSFYAEHVLPRLINRVMDNNEDRRARQRVCSELTGEILEIGFGSGLNLAQLPEAVTKLYAVEPSWVAVRLARTRIAAGSATVQIVGLDGQHLPLPDRSVDAVLCTWSLCTITDPVAAVAEVRRTLRPGGKLHFVEHGIAPDEPVRRWQHRLNGLQQRMAGGCHLTRDIPAILNAGGMTVVQLNTYYQTGQPKPYAATFEGSAEPTT
ncbi:MAG TPA: class I SAM-dependent methyltransferase [Mycobacterium sp.]|nr:class I SAM-dependent methyltransferase [Mycobacterium sp.]